MKTINKLLDKASEACSVTSDRQLAKKIGVSPSAISLWRSGKQIKDDHLMTVIKLAQADPALAVLVRTEGAESPAEKAGWSLVWDRLSPVTTVIGGLVLAVCMMPALARAKPVEIKGLDEGKTAFCILCSHQTGRGERRPGPTHAARPPFKWPSQHPQNRALQAEPSHPASKRPRVGSAHHLRMGLAMRLADFIEQNAREILEDALAFAETQAPDTVEFSAKQLRNHLPQILQAVIDDLRSPQTDAQRLAKSHGPHR